MHWNWIEAVLVSILVCACVLSVSSSDSDKNAEVPKTKYGHRASRAVHEIFLSDPLDCLSQVVCGLNTFPPQVPTPRTSSANDYAFLLQHVVLRLKKQKVIPTTSATTTTTTVSPVDVQDDDDDEDNSDDQEDEKQQDEVESDEEDETSAEIRRKELLKNSKDQNGDVVKMKELYPPLGTIDFYRKGRAIKDNSKMILQKFRKDKKEDKIKQKPQAPRIPTTQSPLQLLRRQQDIREKLRSNARCLYGILDHTCPFKYSELLILMSAVLERQKVISYSTNTILPMAGYLLKSRSLTQTMKATFFALERINNITLTTQANRELPTFSSVYDEIIRGEFPGNGLHIVETRIDAPASTHAWEDDEFDAALKNPFLPREQIPGYAIKDRNKNKKKVSENSPEEDQEEGGELILPENAGPFTVAEFVGRPGSLEYYDENESSENASPEDVPLPPVYGNKYDSASNSKSRRGRN